MLRHAITIFLSALLLFQVQPMAGKVILPWFGGTPAVWTACMLLFQILLLVGYAYAHLLSARLSLRTQSLLHLALLLGSLLWLPIAAHENWKPTGAEMPTWHILALLSVMVGGPYLLLSTTGPLLQSWFANTYPGRSPYRLYALSNVGSLLALLSYPFLLEPNLALGTQTMLWSAGYVAFVVCCGYCCVRLWILRPAADSTSASISGAAAESSLAAEATQGPVANAAAQPGAAPSLGQIGLWLALATCGSVVLLATTNQLCQEVAVVPLLWVAPLAIYLLSFILTFDSDRWYNRNAFGILLGLTSAGAAIAYDLGPTQPYRIMSIEIMSMPVQAAIYMLALLAATMVCHGELARSRPAPRHLTLFFLTIAAGGALGGICVALLAPLVLTTGYWEYQLSLIAACGLALYCYFRRPGTGPVGLALADGPPELRFVRGGLVAAGLMIVAISLFKHTVNQDATLLQASRNFYGVIRVREYDGQTTRHSDHGDRALRSLVHGRTAHGLQYLAPEMADQKTTYYAADSGVGLAIELLRNRRLIASQPIRIGVIGLGTGTLAAYAQSSDSIRFYEINPEVIALANDRFTFLARATARGAEVKTVLGDARICLERELALGEPQRFDVLAVDAFSSDAIPMHLLTLECLDVYLAHLAPDGILAIHVSNQHLELKPVVRALAAERGRHVVWISNSSDRDTGASGSDWLLLSEDKSLLESASQHENAVAWSERDLPPLLWTDNYGSIWQVLRRPAR